MALRAYVAESINVAAIMGVGDGIAQFLIEKRSLSDWDVGRTARFSALGFVVVGPVLRTWYMFMEGRVSQKYTPMRRGLTKMVIDQVLFAPVFTLAMTYTVPKINGEEEEKYGTGSENHTSPYSAGTICYGQWRSSSISRSCHSNTR